MKPLIDDPSSRTVYMREWRARNREKYRAYQAAYKARYYSANRDAMIEQSSQWQAENKEHRRAYLAARYQENKEAVVARVAAWKEKNPEKRKAIARQGSGRYRARKKATSEERINFNIVIARSNGFCGICSEPVSGRFEFDHIVPISKGGPHTESNLQIAHVSCNRKKSASLNYRCTPC